MKLPDEKMLLVGRVAHGCFWADKPATLSDIRAAAKEMGYALVPVEPEFGVMVDTPLDRLFDRLDDFDVPVYGVEEAYKAMIKAAEDEQ